MEGVMMRGQKMMVTAVRRPNGEIVTKPMPLASIYTGWARKTPLLRGIIVLLESVILGIQTLNFSANIALGEEEEKVSGGFIWLMVFIGAGLAIAIFFLAPLFITRLFHIRSALLFNLVDGVIRLAIFIAYLRIVGFMPDIRRVFAYHGAEHKAVNAYEDGVPLEVESVKKYSTAHPRCGTSFLFIVMVIAIIAFALVGKPALWIMILARIVLIPVIAAVAYEVTSFAGRHTRNRLVRIILAPGLWLQSLTTRKPDDRMLEVSITALKKVMELEETPLSPAAGTGVPASG
jgi:uncharacterized protein YqhQ